MKFQVGDKVRQTKEGLGTAEEDNGKEAVVTTVGKHYMRPDDGIIIKPLGKWFWTQEIRGEDAFELSSMDPKDLSLSQVIRKEIEELTK